jgi:apolipoprotein N-acyltransferase
VVSSTPLWTATSLVRDVRFSESATFYARIGDWLPWGSAVLGLLLVLAAAILKPTPVRR